MTRGRPARRGGGAGVLLVAVEDDALAVSVWRAEIGDGRPGRATLAEDGWLALESARRAAAARPTLQPDRLAPAPLRLVFVGRAGSGSVSPALVGSSFGLALALGWSARALGWALPADVVAIACVAPDGAVREVDPDGLRRKLAGLTAAAPDVRRVLVAPTDAARVVAPAGLELVPVASVDAALAVLGAPDPFAALADGDVEPAVMALYRSVRQGGALPVPWTAVVASARQLAERATTPRAAWAADVAARMAARHLGGVEDAAIRWPDAAWLNVLEPRLPGRLQLLAHVVQAAADVGDAAALDAVARARALWARPSQRTEHHARLMGACARALGAAGASRAALALARLTWREWQMLADVGSASFVLVEGLRVADVLGARPEGDEAAALARAAWAHAPQGTIGRAYLAHALARHAAARGDATDAAAWLDRVEVAGGWMPDDLAVGRARLAAALGVASAALHGVLARRLDALCAVDAAVRTPEDADLAHAAWAALAEEPHLLAWRTRIGGRGADALAARVAAFRAGYPYS
jgi:hypothetical protein